MMAKKNAPAPEEHEHATFEDFSIKLTAWLATHRSTLLGIFAVITVIVGATIVFRVNREKQAEARSQEFNIALDALQGALSQNDMVERYAQLEDARAQLDRLAAGQSGPLADFALLLKGNTYYYDDLKIGDADEMGANYRRAAEVYDEYTRRVGDPALRALGFYSKGYAFESLGFLGGDGAAGQLNDALEAYAEAESLAAGTWLDFESKLGRARIHTGREGDEAKARELLEQIIAERGDHPLADVQVVDDRTLERLNSGQRTLLKTISSQINTFGIKQTAELMLDRLGGREG